MLYLTAFVIIASAAGFCLTAPLSRNREGLVQALIFCFPLGSGLAAVIMFCLNQALDVPITRTSIFWVLCAELFVGVGFLSLTYARHGWGRPTDGSEGEIPPGQRSFLPGGGPGGRGRFETASIVMIFFSVFMAAAVNPSFYFDSFMYHLPLPRDIFLNGSMPKWADPTQVGTPNAMPPLQWILYAMSYVVAGRETMLFPGMFPPFFGALCFFLMYRISRMLKHPEYVAMGALLLFLSEYLLGLRILVENNDIVFAFFCLGSTYCLVRFHLEEARTHLLLGAVLIALACWTKTLGYLFLFTLVLAFLLARLLPPFDRHRSFRRTLWHAVVFCTVAFVFILPYLLRNYFLWGNPLYPGFASLLGGYLIDDWAIRYPLAYMMPFRSIYPFSIQTVFGILKAGLIPLIFFVLYLASGQRSKNPLDRFLTLTAVGYLLILLLVSANSPATVLARYLIPAHFIVCILGGSLFLRFIEASERPSTGMSILLGLFFGYHIVLQLFFQVFLEPPGFVSIYLLLLLVAAFLAFFTANPALQRIFDRLWPSWRVKAIVLVAAGLSFLIVFHGTPFAIREALSQTLGVRSGALALPVLVTIRLVILEMTLLVAVVCLVGLVWPHIRTDLLQRVNIRSLTSKGCFLAFLVVLYAFPSLKNVTEALVQDPRSLGVDRYRKLMGPEVDWMHAHLTTDDKVLTFVQWRYFIPAPVVRPDHPLLKDLYPPEATLDESVRLLKELGVSHIYFNEAWTRLQARRYPLFNLFHDSVLVTSLDESPSFSQVFEYYDSKTDGYTRIYRLQNVKPPGSDEEP